MDATYEIFKEQPQGPIWIETVTGLERIKERLNSLNEIKPGAYFAYDVREARIIERLPHQPR